jgi:hypothetical protein
MSNNQDSQPQLTKNYLKNQSLIALVCNHLIINDL